MVFVTPDGVKMLLTPTAPASSGAVPVGGETATPSSFVPAPAGAPQPAAVAANIPAPAPSAPAAPTVPAPLPAPLVPPQTALNTQTDFVNRLLAKAQQPAVAAPDLRQQISAPLLPPTMTGNVYEQTMAKLRAKESNYNLSLGGSSAALQPFYASQYKAPAADSAQGGDIYSQYGGLGNVPEATLNKSAPGLLDPRLWDIRAASESLLGRDIATPIGRAFQDKILPQIPVVGAPLSALSNLYDVGANKTGLPTTGDVAAGVLSPGGLALTGGIAAGAAGSIPRAFGREILGDVAGEFAGQALGGKTGIGGAAGAALLPLLGGGAAAGIAEGLVRGAPQALGEAAQSAARNIDVAQPTVTQRLLSGAIDPETGRPFDYAAVLGGAKGPTAIGKPRVPEAKAIPLPERPATPPLSPLDTTLRLLPETRRSSFREFSQEASVIQERARVLAHARDKLQTIIRETTARPDRPEVKAQQAAQFQGQREALVEAVKEGFPPEVATRRAIAAMSVDEPVGSLGPRTLRDSLTPEEKAVLYDEANMLQLSGEIDQGQFATLAAALKTALSDGEVPPASQRRALADLLGIDYKTTRALEARRIQAERIAARRVEELQWMGARSHEDALKSLATQERNAAKLAERQVAEVQRIGADIHARVVRADMRKLAAQERELVRMEQRSAKGAGAFLNKKLAQARRTADDAAARLYRAETAEFRRLHREAGPVAVLANQDAVISRWKRVVSDGTISPKLKEMAVTPVQKELIDHWDAANKVLLDSIPDATSIFKRWANVVTGKYSDSYLTGLAWQEQSLAAALISAGDDADVAKAMARALAESDIAVRYGPIYRVARAPGTYPKLAEKFAREQPEKWAKVNEIVEQLKEARQPITDDMLLTLVQRSKNFAFSIDFGIGGQQGLAALRGGNVPMLIGLINKVAASLGHPLANTLGDAEFLNKQTIYALDGRGRGLASSAVDPGVGSILQYFPRWSGLPKFDEKVFHPISAALNNTQFIRGLQRVGDGIHEGNLVMAHLVGADITNPKVRADISKMSNHTVSWARTAVDPRYSKAERIAFTSAAMTRSGVNRVLDMAKLISPRASRAQRVVAAGSIISTYVVYSTLAKTVNDLIGMDEIELNPLKRGFGYITSPWKDADGRNIIFSIFPQSAFERSAGKAFQMAIDYVQGDDVQVEEFRNIWLQYASGRSSIAGRIGMAALGIGFEPGEGFKFGDLYEGKGISARAINMAPLPPWLQSAIIDSGSNPLTVGGDFMGVQAFGESASDALARNYEEATGRDYWEDTKTREGKARIDKVLAGDPALQALADTSLEEAAPSSPGAAAALENKRITKEVMDRQLLDDAALDAGAMTPDQWEEKHNKRQAKLRAQRELIFSVIPDKPPRDAVEEYFEIIDRYVIDKTTDEVDWEKVNAAVALKPQSWQNYVAEWTGLGGTPTEREYRADIKALAATGYYDEKRRTAFILSGTKAAQEAEAVLQKWDKSPTVRAAVKATRDAIEQQAEIDDQFRTGDPAWRDATKTLAVQLLSTQGGIFAELEGDKVMGDIITQYYAKIKETQKGNQFAEPDWAEVERWKSLLTPAQREAIDSRERAFLSQEVKDWKEASQRIAATGYWEVGDRLLERWIVQHPELQSYYDAIVVGQGGSYSEMFGALEKDIADRMAERGMTQSQVDALVPVVLGKLSDDFDDTLGEIRLKMRLTNPDLLADLAHWGYYPNPSKKAREILLKY